MASTSDVSSSSVSGFSGQWRVLPKTRQMSELRGLRGSAKEKCNTDQRPVQELVDRLLIPSHLRCDLWRDEIRVLTWLDS